MSHVPLAVALALSLGGCSGSEHANGGAKDVCVRPMPLDMKTLEEARKQPGGEGLTQNAVDYINRSNGLASCVEEGAFEARKVTGSMQEVADAIVAQCASQATLTKLAGHTAGMKWNDADFDASTKSDSLASVLRYRECAVGES